MIHGVDTSFLVAVELVSHARHGDSRCLRDRFLKGGEQFALVPQVLAEFVHIVTDPRRCAERGAWSTEQGARSGGQGERSVSVIRLAIRVGTLVIRRSHKQRA